MNFTPNVQNTSIRSSSSMDLETSTQSSTISTPNPIHTSTLPTLSTLPTDNIPQVVPNLCKTINRTEDLN